MGRPSQLGVSGEFSSRIALVTGGSGGIGSAICRGLAARGAAVAIGYGANASAAESLAAEITSEGAVARAFAADMENPAAPADLVKTVEAVFGQLDVLVANHGLGQPARYEDVDAQLFDRTLAINLRAPFLLAQAALSGMRDRRFGRILFISSAAAFKGGVLGPHYAASKAGLHGLTYFLASRAAQDGVTVNALAPGFVETPMLQGDRERLARAIPVGRVGRPEEVADLAVAVLANAYLTNHVLSIDGGMHPR
jgi:3-oxoacyl-[acyl-carrier protein] reductase